MSEFEHADEDVNQTPFKCARVVVNAHNKKLCGGVWPKCTGKRDLVIGHSSCEHGESHSSASILSLLSPGSRLSDIHSGPKVLDNSGVFISEFPRSPCSMLIHVACKTIYIRKTI